MPKIDPLRQAIKASIAAMLDVPAGAVGINASTGENLTAFGKGEGIQVFAIVSLVSRALPGESSDPSLRL
jgi:2-C-methyl-D-erythritol 2,4-cyclodiphosphate synthase